MENKNTEYNEEQAMDVLHSIADKLLNQAENEETEMDIRIIAHMVQILACGGVVYYPRDTIYNTILGNIVDGICHKDDNGEYVERYVMTNKLREIFKS